MGHEAEDEEPCVCSSEPKAKVETTLLRINEMDMLFLLASSQALRIDAQAFQQELLGLRCCSQGLQIRRGTVVPLNPFAVTMCKANRKLVV